MSVRPWSGVSLGSVGVREGGTCDIVWAGQESPSAQPGRRARDRVYKPMVKSLEGSGRSEGAVVLGIGVQKRAGREGPSFDHAWEEGSVRGMPG